MKKWFLICMLWSSASYSYTDYQSPSFETQLEYSDIVAVIKITNIEDISGCGTLVTANVVKSFKGPIDKLQFWVQHPADLIEKRDFYFMLASYGETQEECAQSNIWISPKEGRQRLFAFAFGYNSNGEDLILANRQSFLAGTNYLYNEDKLVKAFVVLKYQIYAVGRWEEVLKIIQKKLTPNNPQKK